MSKSGEMDGTLARAKDVIKEQEAKIKFLEAEIERLCSLSPVYAPVVAAFDLGKKKGGKRAIIKSEGKHYEVSIPGEEADKVSTGSMIKLTQQTAQYIGLVGEFDTPAGRICPVTQVVSESQLEIQDRDGARLVTYFGKAPEVGDRVMVDFTDTIILKNLGKEEKVFTLEEEINVEWDQVGGLERAKAELQEAVILPQQNPDLFRHYGKKRVKGILMYGGPGNGKTLMAKALATDVARHFRRDAGSTSGFMYVKGPEILSKWVGEAEATIRKIFERARHHQKMHGYPAIIFLDEADAVLGKRGMGRSSDVERTIVPQFLSEMDGLNESGAFFLMATNRADTLDPAVLRDGRVDRKIYVPSPTKETAVEIFKIHIAGKPLFTDSSMEGFSEQAIEILYREDFVLLKLELRNGEKVNMCLGDIVNGAMIEGLCERATSVALRRDMKEGKRSGISMKDVAEATKDLLAEQRQLDHKDIIEEKFGNDVKKAMRVENA